LFLFLCVTLVNISLNFICQISSFYFLLILISPLDTPQNMINPVCSRRVAHLKRFRVNGFLKYYFQCTKKCSASSCAEGGVTCFVLFFLCQSFKHTKFLFFLHAHLLLVVFVFFLHAHLLLVVFVLVFSNLTSLHLSCTLPYSSVTSFSIFINTCKYFTILLQ